MSPTAGGRLRDLLEARDLPLVKPGVHDALGAMLVERAGFDVVGISGYACAASLFAKPDVGLLGLTDMVEVAERVAAAVGLPVIADADTGFGNAIGVMWTVERFVRAGVAAIHIEDQVMPKRCGHVAGKEILPLDEAVGKIRAAHHARSELDPSFILIARTDARGVANGTIAEVVLRGKAYADAGADMIFPDALLTEDELAECAMHIPVPLHYNRTLLSPRLSRKRLSELNVAIVSNPDAELLPMVVSVLDYLRRFYAEDIEFQVQFERDVEGAAGADLHELLGFARVRELELQYLPADQLHRRYEGSVGYGARDST